MDLTPHSESRNVSPKHPPVGAAGKVAPVNPRLVAALMLLACLLGIAEPALACVSASHCCSSGCNGQPQPGSGGVRLEECCGLQATLGASLSIAPQTGQALNVAGGSPAFIALAGPVLLVPTREKLTAQAATTFRSDQSLTYLRTARLRL